jgi:hypothetical protein
MGLVPELSAKRTSCFAASPRRALTELAAAVALLSSACDHPSSAGADSSGMRAVEAGTFRDRRVNEVSGIVAVRGHADCFWVHNDSGDKPRLFAVRASGTVIAELAVTGASAIDWEDIARGPGSDPDEDFLYVADTGNNFRLRQSLAVYRLPEPRIERLEPGQQLASEPAAVFRFRFPDGIFDCEAALVGPDGEALYLITKVRGDAGVYRIALSAPPETGVQTAVHVARMSPGGLVTAADLSADGGRLLLLTYGELQEYALPPGADFERIFAQPGTLLTRAFSRLQVEAACYEPATGAPLVLHEGFPVRLYRLEVDPGAGSASGADSGSGSEQSASE